MDRVQNERDALWLHRQTGLQNGRVLDLRFAAEAVSESRGAGNVMMSSRTAGSLLIALLMTGGCSRASEQPAAVTSTAHSVEEAMAIIASGRCADAIEILGGISERQPVWYEAMSQAHMYCWQSTGSQDHAAKALEVIEDGLRAFPANANLLLSKGYRYRDMKLPAPALAAFSAAAARAAANLAGGGRSPADESVLREANAEIRRLPPQSGPVYQAGSFEQQILRMIASQQ